MLLLNAGNIIANNNLSVYAKAGQDESASARQLDPRAVARAIHQFQLSDDEMSEGDPEED